MVLKTLDERIEAHDDNNNRRVVQDKLYKLHEFREDFVMQIYREYNAENNRL